MICATVLAIELFVDEVVVERVPGVSRTWRTVEERLLVTDP